MTIDQFISQALIEDLGDGDHTTNSCIPLSTRGKAKLLVKENGVLAGVDIARKVFNTIDPGLAFTALIEDGTDIQRGDIAFYLEGHVASILSGERLALNFMQRMSGIATHTRELVKIIDGTGARILDTRKTTPNFRWFEKEAVRIGGGTNHRFGLYDMIMIKDNHVDYAGGIAAAIKRTNEYLRSNNKDLRIEIEVRNFDELKQLMDHGGVHRIMLDNFQPEELAKAVKTIDRQYETEASGGITADNIREYAEAGVDFISIGALTHHIQSLDLSLKAL